MLLFPSLFDKVFHYVSEGLHIFELVFIGDIGYGPWSNFGECPVTCGKGRRARYRECLPGKECNGTTVDYRECDTDVLCKGKSENKITNNVLGRFPYYNISILKLKFYQNFAEIMVDISVLHICQLAE